MIPPSGAEAVGGKGPDDPKAGAAGSAATSRTAEQHKNITMADIAKAAGVSQGAISSLLNDRDYGIRVSEKTRERVFRVCRELGYVPNDLRAVVRMYPEQGDFCVLIDSSLPDLPADPFQTRIISGAAGVIEDPSRSVILARYEADADYSGDPAPPLPHPVRNGTASKFLIIGKANLSLCQALISRGFGVAIAGGELSAPGITSILPDFASASRTAIDYLFNLGHKRLAILSGPFGATDSHIIELNRGVRAGYDKAGVSIEAQNIIYGDLTMEAGFKALDTIMDRSQPPTAVFCFNDAAAAGVLSSAQARGMKVPDDLTIIGCSDDAISAHLHPALSTVHLPAEEMGATGVRETERRVRERDAFPSEAKRLLLPVKMIERASSGAPKAR